MAVDCVALFAQSGGFWCGDSQKQLPGGYGGRANRVGEGSRGSATELFRPAAIFIIRARWLMLWVTPEEKVAIRAKGWAPIH